MDFDAYPKNLVTCYARTPQTRTDFAQRFGCTPCSSYAEMLEDPDVDGILLMPPNQARREQVVAAAARGKHVVVVTSKIVAQEDR
jgi:predicted dehydrogenase